jgi:hypothetical protein
VASDYQAICVENQQRYGTDIGRIGPMLLADRYDDRTHFIFELLQNAEDALGRRSDWQGSRGVAFQLTSGTLTLSHFGKPFDAADVQGVCGIAQSTKDLTAIGRFGIGFKSVYTFTDRPEIHSGNEDFVVEKFVLPVHANRNTRSDDETTIVLPLRKDDSKAATEISDGLKQLGASALLFLRHIEEITWNVPGGSSGIYLRSKPVTLGSNAQRITVIGQESGKLELDQYWLVFHREVSIDGGSKTGRVEIAFSIVPVKDSPGRWSVQPVADSPLVVYFPTVLSTNLGFLVQGPYRTTPSRDNVPRGDSWNQLLVRETASLLVEALRWLRDNEMLDTSALRCLPLDRAKFPEHSMFAPLFDAVRDALVSEPLLPRFDGGYVAASKAKLARTQELRELFSPKQVGVLYGGDGDLAWLSSDVTQDRSPELRQYVMRELSIAEITPEAILPKLDKAFLEAQPDEWVLRLYEFLSGQTALRRRLDIVPLIRLTDGSHVVARTNGQPLAFLPSAIETAFPTMRRAVCATSEVRAFLASLGITEPDPVDDVVWNIPPKYRAYEVDVNDEDYAADIEKIRTAFSTDSKIQREKLLSALRETPFVMAVDAGDGSKRASKPGEIYLATERLKQLFAGVSGILLVDDSYDCLRGENLRELLEACGAVRYPRPVEQPTALNHIELSELRKQAGHEETSGIKDRVQDWTLLGFDALIKALPTLDREDRIKRGSLIWESLGDLEERRGRGLFEGAYSWTHYGSYKAEFPAAFMRHLNTAAWVPDAQGELQQPPYIVFDTLGWKPNPFILSKVAFKPPIIEMLAKEAGIDPAVLDWLKKNGVTSEADLKARLGIPEHPTEPDETDAPPGGDVYDDAKNLYGDMPDIHPGTPDPNGGDDVGTGGAGPGGGGGSGRPTNNGGSLGGGNGTGGHTGSGDKTDDRTGKGGGSPGKRTPGGSGGRPFISYVGTHPDEEEPDSDGLDQAARMKLEELAIQQILAVEPKLNRTPAFNAGYDLFENGSNGQPIRWVEVKAMTGTLRDRPVGLSHTQFEWARQHGSAFWLYVVEQASTPDGARILRIQDPAANARTFTFDHGWAGIAKTEPV